MPAQALILSLGAGLLAGLASIAHCAAMCGPLACFATTSAPGRGRALRYQVGRTISYAGLGAVVGSAGDVVVRTFGGALAGALVSWVFAAALGLAALRLWRVNRPASITTSTVSLGRSRGGRTLTDRLLAILPKDPLLFGAATALLPCGALYGALFLAAASATAVGGGAFMIGFATASGLGLVSVAWASTRLRGRLSPLSLRVVAVMLAVAAVFIAIRPAATLAQPEDATPACCAATE